MESDKWTGSSPPQGQSAFNLYFREYTEVADGKKRMEQKYLEARMPQAKRAAIP